MTTMGQTVMESRCQSKFKGENPLPREEGISYGIGRLNVLPLAEGLGKGTEDSALPALHHS